MGNRHDTAAAKRPSACSVVSQSLQSTVTTAAMSASSIAWQTAGRKGMAKVEFPDGARVLADKRNLPVVNAPSPAATASLAIGERIVAEIAGMGW
jgi:hypothetical protein